MEGYQKITEHPNIIIIYSKDSQNSFEQFINIFSQHQQQSYDNNEKIWKISTKYYDATVQLQEIMVNFLQIEESIDIIRSYISFQNSFIILFSKDNELSINFYQLIQAIQDEFNPEMSLLLYDGQKNKIFNKEKEKIIDNLVQNYFIEYIKEDLKEYHNKIQQNTQIENQITGSLLTSEEKIGFERIIEALQCCLWSNMKKKKVNNEISQQLMNEYNQQQQKQEEDKYENNFENYQLNEQEQEVEDLFGIIEEIKQLKTQNQLLSEEERRKNAEDIIAKIGKYMDLNEDESDDENK